MSTIRMGQYTLVPPANTVDRPNAYALIGCKETIVGTALDILNRLLRERLCYNGRPIAGGGIASLALEAEVLQRMSHRNNTAVAYDICNAIASIARHCYSAETENYLLIYTGNPNEDNWVLILDGNIYTGTAERILTKITNG